MKVALFGGAFDPPHIAHWDICDHLTRKLDFDEVWLIPCAKHPLGKEMTPFEHRVNMCKIITDTFAGLADVYVKELEADLVEEVEHPGTIDLLRKIKEMYPHVEFTFIIGGDIPQEFHRWKEASKLKKEAKFLVFERSDYPMIEGWTYLDHMTNSISSSKVRKWIADEHENINYALVAETFEYIKDNGLYGITKQEKVYCKYCRYVRLRVGFIRCFHPLNRQRTSSNFFGQGKKRWVGDPSELNAKNKCAWYTDGNVFRVFWTWLKKNL